MKKGFLLSLTLIALLNVQAQCNEEKSYLTAEQVPDAAYYLPAPPDTSSIAFLADYSRYNWGKSQRNSSRGRQADFDTHWQADSILKGFESAFGFLITKQDTPATYELIYKVCIDAERSVAGAKRRYMRIRPFLQFHEHTNCPAQEKELCHTGSYPSGHSARGWAVALILSELRPECQNMILERGYQYGESRIIEGYHYQSDVEAARLAASAIVARLHASDVFMRQLVKAKKELKKINIK
jgi:acid phosphatase (class A)